jgi:hypothetical protein
MNLLKYLQSAEMDDLADSRCKLNESDRVPLEMELVGYGVGFLMLKR